jgi:hypothetical protein
MSPPVGRASTMLASVAAGISRLAENQGKAGIKQAIRAFGPSQTSTFASAAQTSTLAKSIPGAGHISSPRQFFGSLSADQKLPGLFQPRELAKSLEMPQPAIRNGLQGLLGHLRGDAESQMLGLQQAEGKSHRAFTTILNMVQMFDSTQSNLIANLR